MARVKWGQAIVAHKYVNSRTDGSMLGLGKITKKVFGTPNDRKIKATRPIVEQINALEPDFEKLSDEGLKEKTEELAKRAAKALTIFCQKPLQIAVRPPSVRWVCGPLTCS